MPDFVAFTDGSAIRRVNNEGVLLLGGGRALLMQIAHPLVARGVVDHSSYQTDRVGRLLGTLRPMYAIAFGTSTEARTAAAHVNALHERVRGDSYRATDPELLAWVLATLIDTSLVTHARFFRPLGAEETQRYYEDMLRVGSLLLLPEDALPPDVAGFQRYVNGMVASLYVSDAARGVARELFEPLPGSGPLLLVARELTAGLLPPRLRRAYGFGWDPPRQALLNVVASLSRHLLPLTPPSMRRPPWFLLPPTTTRS